MRIVVDDILTVEDQKMQLLPATLIDKEIKVRHEMASNHFCVKRAALFSIAVAGQWLRPNTIKTPRNCGYNQAVKFPLFGQRSIRKQQVDGNDSLLLLKKEKVEQHFIQRRSNMFLDIKKKKKKKLFSVLPPSIESSDSLTVCRRVIKYSSHLNEGSSHHIT